MRKKCNKWYKTNDNLQTYFEVTSYSQATTDFVKLMLEKEHLNSKNRYNHHAIESVGKMQNLKSFNSRKDVSIISLLIEFKVSPW